MSPLTAGGLDPCLRMSELAASVAALRTRGGRAAAARILFGDRSF
ncbi:hypothetical protein AB0J42_17745 [Nonomuraea sp. NPDC049649]